MNKVQETIFERFENIPEDYFLNKNKLDESIYINLDEIGYKIDSEGKIFKTNAGIQRNFFEIKSSDIKPTKTETINHLLIKFKRQAEAIKLAGLSRKSQIT